jgi:hypothetical protein
LRIERQLKSYPSLCHADTDSVSPVTDEIFGNDGSALQKDIDAFAGGKKKSAAPAKALSADDKADIAKFEAWVWLVAVFVVSSIEDRRRDLERAGLDGAPPPAPSLAP